MSATILHISNDYPDVLDANKTKAVYNLIAGVPEFSHVIYSLNRVDGFSGIEALPSGEGYTAVAYGALPKGIAWHGRLKALAAWILADIRQKGIRPDLIHTHKLTVEGVIGQILSKELGIPFITDIRGDSDSKIFHNKRSLQGLYRQIAAEASVVFARAPWTIDLFERIAGLDRAKTHPLPVIPGVLAMRPAPYVETQRLLTVFHLDSWKRKNLMTMVAAIYSLKERFPNIALDVYGRGSPKTLLEVRKALRDAAGREHVHLKGPVKHEAMQALMPDYAAFVLPSKRESYGMVYAEALFNGLPVVYSKNWGIDGYFKADDIGYVSDADSVEDVAKGMAYVLEHQAALKQSIAAMQEGGAFHTIQKEQILGTYRRGIEAALG